MPGQSERRLVATMFMSLDGVVESPQNWSFPFWNEEMEQFKNDEQEAADAMLLGRVTYEAFAAAWPSRTGDFADRFNAMPKYVASRTLSKADWKNSHILQGDLATGVTRLKEQPGRDILIHGSVSLINQLLQRGLIDELRLLVFPVVLGSGKRLFEEGKRTDLKLRESRAFSKGVVAMVYGREDEAPPKAEHRHAPGAAAR